MFEWFETIGTEKKPTLASAFFVLDGKKTVVASQIEMQLVGRPACGSKTSANWTSGRSLSLLWAKNILLLDDLIQWVEANLNRRSSQHESHELGNQRNPS